jgi:hypothetical protein
VRSLALLRSEFCRRTALSTHLNYLFQRDRFNNKIINSFKSKACNYKSLFKNLKLCSFPMLLFANCARDRNLLSYFVRGLKTAKPYLSECWY